MRIYGTLGKNGMFTETTPIAPNSPYSASKASADMLVRAYNKTFKLPMNITRCSNNYVHITSRKTYTLIIANTLEEKLFLCGDGMQIREIGYM